MRSLTPFWCVQVQGQNTRYFSHLHIHTHTRYIRSPPPNYLHNLLTQLFLFMCVGNPPPNSYTVFHVQIFFSYVLESSLTNFQTNLNPCIKIVWRKRSGTRKTGTTKVREKNENESRRNTVDYVLSTFHCLTTTIISSGFLKVRTMMILYYNMTMTRGQMYSRNSGTTTNRVSEWLF